MHLIRYVLKYLCNCRAIPNDLWGVIQNTHSFTIRQHLKLLPKHCCGCPPCVKQENTYSIYAGLTENAEAEVLRVDEVSDDWNRCCCAPFHPVRLEVRQYVPMPGDGSNSDYAHINQDMLNSWNTLTAGNQQERAHEIYKQYPPVMSFVRYIPLCSLCFTLLTFSYLKIWWSKMLLQVPMSCLKHCCLHGMLPRWF